ncbi:MAG: hypothetical protein J6C86_09840 [Bacteroidaceae bacterium]|nr:hypothetical protein [Bacteroidaceae bacterium]
MDVFTDFFVTKFTIAPIPQSPKLRRKAKFVIRSQHYTPLPKKPHGTDTEECNLFGVSAMKISQGYHLTYIRERKRKSYTERAMT